MPTGYEVAMYRDLSRIADALEMIAKAMTPREPAQNSQADSGQLLLSDYEQWLHRAIADGGGWRDYSEAAAVLEGYKATVVQAYGART